MHAVISIKQRSDIQQIVGALAGAEAGLGVRKVADDLEPVLSDQVKSVLVEYPYVDKDYRSTYYNFYAKKSLRYSAFCARLHFFREDVAVTSQPKIETKSGNNLESAYLGFMVIRPTHLYTIGRTVLSPHALLDFRGHVIKGSHSVHIFGQRLVVEGFPFMKQHSDIAVCAHVACWSILRHFSERFSRYGELLTYDITRLGSPNSPGGHVPSRGLTVAHAATILAQAGAYPDVHTLEAYKKTDPEMFYRVLYSYVESGLPLFAGMNTRKHAITVLGHGPIPVNVIPKAGISYAWDYIQSLVVADDNYLPYRTVTRNPADFHYVLDEIDSFVVPLPEKIYLTSTAVMKRTEKLLKDKKAYNLDWSVLSEPVIRHFLTTSSAFKRFTLNSSTDIPAELLTASLELPMPQFIWVAEVSTPLDWAAGRCHLRFVFDATANDSEARPFFILHDKNRMVVYDRGFTGKLSEAPFGKTPIGTFRLFEENLQRV